MRTIELDLKTSASTTSSSSGYVSGDKKKSQVSQIIIPDIDASLNAILRKLEEMDTRIMEVEREVKRMILVLDQDQEIITTIVVKITNHSAKVDSNLETIITKETLTEVIENSGDDDLNE